MRKYAIIALSLAVLSAASCSVREGMPSGKGLLTVSLSSDITADAVVVKGEAGAPNPAFSLEITPKGGGQSIKVADYRTLSDPAYRQLYSACLLRH